MKEFKKDMYNAFCSSNSNDLLYDEEKVYSDLFNLYLKKDLENFQLFLVEITKDLNIFQINYLMENFYVDEIFEEDLEEHLQQLIKKYCLEITKQRILPVIKKYNLYILDDINKINNKSLHQAKMLKFLKGFDLIDISMINYISSYCDYKNIFVTDDIIRKIFINACINNNPSIIRTRYSYLLLDPFDKNEQRLDSLTVLDDFYKIMDNNYLNNKQKVTIIKNILNAVPEYDINTYDGLGPYGLDYKNLFLILDFHKDDFKSDSDFIELYNYIKAKTSSSDKVEEINRRL